MWKHKKAQNIVCIVNILKFKKRDSPNEISKGILVACYYINNMYNMLRKIKNKDDLNITIKINKVLYFLLYPL